VSIVPTPRHVGHHCPTWRKRRRWGRRRRWRGVGLFLESSFCLTEFFVAFKKKKKSRKKKVFEKIFYI